MTSIKLTVSGASARAEVDGLLTSGMVGIPVAISYDSAWDGLTKALVCRGGSIARTILNVDGTATVPHECMIANATLQIGVEGRNADGTLVIPTVWARCGLICSGANANADPSTDPTLPVWAQIQSMIGNLDDLNTEAKNNLVDAVNEAMTKGGGEVDPKAVQQIVADYLAANPPTITETDPTVPSWAKAAQKPPYTADEVGAIAYETDPTVPEWAKQPTKPTYTAAEVGALPTSTVIPTVPDNVSAFRNDAGYLTEHQDISGKLDASELPTAINTALAQAKANGEFDGSPGADGKSAYQYAQDGGYTGTEAEFAEKLAQEYPDGILEATGGTVTEGNLVVWDVDRSLVRDGGAVPEKLPNPNALTFTGAVTGSYDGSEPLTVNIPSGGGNADRRWKLIKTLNVSTDVAQEYFDTDDEGNSFSVQEILITGTLPNIGTGYLFCRPSLAGNVGNVQIWPTASKKFNWYLGIYNNILKTTIAVSNNVIAGPFDKNVSCPERITGLTIGASTGYNEAGTIYVYGR